MAYPHLRQTVLDAPDNRTLAEFYRQLLGYSYRPGDEPPAQQQWLVLVGPEGQRLAFAQVDHLPAATWPQGPVPQMLHLDLTVPDTTELDVQHERALALGAVLLQDRSDDEEEPLRVYADPAGHPFCVFVAS
jgi:hypothetical protein